MEEVQKQHYEEVHNISNDMRSLKTKAIFFLLGLIIAVIGYGIWVGTIQTRVTRNESDLAKITSKIETLVSSNNQSQVQMADINARLKNLEVILIEIREQLKN